MPVVQSLLQRTRNVNFLKKGGAVKLLMISEDFAAAACQSCNHDWVGRVGWAARNL